jgi:hypothetical protein
VTTPTTDRELTPDLPDDVDPELWFYSERCHGRDYVFDSHWHTHPGRMAVFCPHSTEWPNYRISLSEMPADLPTATKYWVRGFLAGNLPRQPADDEDDTPAMQRWREKALSFAREGYWEDEDEDE